jgi:hypothetical protein
VSKNEWKNLQNSQTFFLRVSAATFPFAAWTSSSSSSSKTCFSTGAGVGVVLGLFSVQ